MRKFELSVVNQNMTKEQERDLAIQLLDDGAFWLNNTFCKVIHIERNNFPHYFVQYYDSISDNVKPKQLLVACLKEVK